MLISVQSSQAIYKHVVVVWRNKIFDFECMHTYPLTEESLRQVCGVHTTFQRIVSGYGIFPSKKFAPHQKMPMYKIGVWMIITKKVVQLGGILCVINKKLAVG